MTHETALRRVEAADRRLTYLLRYSLGEAVLQDPAAKAAFSRRTREKPRELAALDIAPESCIVN